MFKSINPATGREIATYPELSPAEIEQKLATAMTSFQDWRRTGSARVANFRPPVLGKCRQERHTENHSVEGQYHEICTESRKAGAQTRRRDRTRVQRVHGRGTRREEGATARVEARRQGGRRKRRARGAHVVRAVS